MCDPQEGPTLTRPAPGLPSNLKTFPSPDLGDMVASHVRAGRMCRDMLALHPHFTNGETKAQRGSLGEPRSQRFLTALARVLVLRPRAQWAQSRDLADGGRSPTLSPPLLLATDGKWRLRMQRVRLARS